MVRAARSIALAVAVLPSACGGIDLDAVPEGDPSGTYELVVTGSTSDPAPAARMPETVDLVVDLRDDGTFSARVDGENARVSSVMTAGDRVALVLDTVTIPVELVDVGDCPIEWVHPSGPGRVLLDDGHAEGTSAGRAYCDSSSARFEFGLVGDRL